MTIKEFGQKVKAKYPQYSDMSDEELGQKVLTKYPQYQDMVDSNSVAVNALAQNKDDDKKTVGGFVSNVFSSGGKAIGDVWKSATDPVGTIQGMGKTIAGGIQSIPGISNAYDNIAKGKGKEALQENRQSFNNLIGYFGNRYGGKDVEEVAKNVSDTVYKDPVGFLFDLSTVIGGGSGALKKMGLTKEASILEKANPAVNASKIASKTSELTNKATGKIVSETLGASTGAGSKSIQEAFKGSKDFIAASKGKITSEQIVKNVQDGISQLRINRGTEYQSLMDKLQKRNPQTFDISPVENAFSKTIEQYRGKIGKDGSIDLSVSPLINDQKKIEAIKGLVNDWKSKPQELTVQGVDTLKRQLRDFKEPNNASLNRLVDRVANSTKNILNDVRGYKEMEAKYASKSEFINQLEKSFGSENIDTAINKLTVTMKQNKEFRQNILEELDKATKKNITGQVTGSMMNNWLPQGQITKLAVGGIGAGAAFSGGISLIPYLTLASPRVVATFLRYVGGGSRRIKKINQMVNQYKDLINKSLTGGYYEEKTK